MAKALQGTVGSPSLLPQQELFKSVTLITASTANFADAPHITALQLAIPLPANDARSSHPITVTLKIQRVTHVLVSRLLLVSVGHPAWSISELSHTSSQEGRNITPWLHIPSWLLVLPAVTFNGHQTVCASKLKVSWRLCQILPFLLRSRLILCLDCPCSV